MHRLMFECNAAEVTATVDIPCTYRDSEGCGGGVLPVPSTELLYKTRRSWKTKERGIAE